MNTMLKNNNNFSQNNIMNKFNDFIQEIKRTNKTPEQLLNEVIKSGKFSNQQIEQAKMLASLICKKS